MTPRARAVRAVVDGFRDLATPRALLCWGPLVPLFAAVEIGLGAALVERSWAAAIAAFAAIVACFGLAVRSAAEWARCVSWRRCCNPAAPGAKLRFAAVVLAGIVAAGTPAVALVAFWSGSAAAIAVMAVSASLIAALLAPVAYAHIGGNPAMAPGDVLPLSTAVFASAAPFASIGVVIDVGCRTGEAEALLAAVFGLATCAAGGIAAVASMFGRWTEGLIAKD